MRKNSYTPKIWGSFSLPQLSLSRFSWNRSGKLKGQKAEDPHKFTIRLNKDDQERYLHSFLKKIILSTWKEQRFHIQMNFISPPSFEKRLYQDTYTRLKPLLLAAFNEDFKLPYTHFTLSSWLQYVKLLAQVTGKYRDARCWEELHTFIYNCSKYDLIDV